MEALVGLWDGIVVSIDAPATEPEGSVKVRIPDIHGSVGDKEFVPDVSLPWAWPNFNFAGALCGWVGVPPVNAIVNIIFKHGNARYPFWIGGGHRTGEAPTDYLAAKQGLTPRAWTWVSPGGYSVTINEGTQALTLKTPLGLRLTLDEAAAKATLETPAGQSLEMDDVSGECVVTGNAKAVLTAALMEIGLGATQAAVLGTAFMGLFNAHKHSYFPGPLAQAVTSPPTMPMVAGTHTSAVTKLK